MESQDSEESFKGHNEPIVSSKREGISLLDNSDKKIQEMKNELLSKIDNIQLYLQEYQKNLPPRNHNNPPELVEPDPLPPRVLRIVVEAASELREVAQQETPQPEKLEEQASVLRAVARSLIAWIGRKVDLTVDSAIKWAVPVSLLDHSEKIYAALIAVANAASDLAHYLLLG